MVLSNNIFEKVYRKLQTQLPSYLLYHHAGHTRYVVEKAIFLAQKEQVKKNEQDLIAIAALYHDTGFLIQRENHERLGCEIARKELKPLDISPTDVQRICRMIMATKIPQQPETLSEKIVADADLFYLGTGNYNRFSQGLYEELKHFNPELDEKAWLKEQQKFLRSHKYHSSYGRKFLEPVKAQNLSQLELKSGTDFRKAGK